MRYSGARVLSRWRLNSFFLTRIALFPTNDRPVTVCRSFTVSEGNSRRRKQFFNHQYCNGCLFSISVPCTASKHLLFLRLVFSSSAFDDGGNNEHSSASSVFSADANSDQEYHGVKGKPNMSATGYRITIKNRSDAEWKELHQALLRLDPRQFTVADVVESEQCMRWCAQTCRSLLKASRAHRAAGDKKQKSNTPSPESEAAAQAVVAALELFGHTVTVIAAHPELLQQTGHSSKESLIHWYDGQYPRASHLLNAILDAWRICWIQVEGNNTKLLPSPESVLRVVKDQWSDHVPLNARTYTIIMDAPVATMPDFRSGMPLYHVPLFCEEIIEFMFLQKMPKEVLGRPPYQHSAEMSLLPDCLTYTVALNAWARCGLPEASSRAEALYQQFVTHAANGTLEAAPNTFCYNTLLIAMTAQPKTIVNNREAILKFAFTPPQPLDKSLMDIILQREFVLNRAEQMFRSMQTCPFKDVIPDKVSCRTIIYAWADYSLLMRYINRKMSVEFMDRAVALLYEATQSFVDSGSTNLGIDSSFFGKLIATVAMNQPAVVDSAVYAELRKAEEIFEFLQSFYRQTNDDRFKPSVDLWSVMILVYAKLGLPEEAEAILHHLEDIARERNRPQLLPGASYYRDVADSWLTFGIEKMKHGHEEAAAVAGEKAEKIVFRMIDLARNTNNLSFVPVRPMTSRVLELWTLCHRPECAEKFLRLTEEVNAVSGFKDLQTRADQFRHLLISWASDETIISIDSSQNAERLLYEMKERYVQTKNSDWRPSAKMISMVIASWTRTDYPDLVGKCKGLLDFACLEYFAGNDIARPDVVMYCTILHAFVKSGDGLGAMRLIENMLKDYYQNHNDSAKPNTRVFNMVLWCWLKSKELSAPQYALEVFQMMESLSFEKLDTKPDLRTFNMMSEILRSATSTELMEKRKYFVEQRDLLASKQDK